MATTIYTGSVGGFRAKIVLTPGTPNSSTKKTTVNYTITADQTSTSYNTALIGNVHISISAVNGSVSTNAITTQSSTITASSGISLGSGSFVITHDNNGKGSCKVTLYATINSSTQYGTDTVTASNITIYTKCGAPSTITASGYTKLDGTVEVSWSGASAGSNNKINGYRIYYTVTSGGTAPTTNTTTYKDVSSTSTSGSTTITLSLSNNQRGYKVVFGVVTKGKAGSFYWSNIKTGGSIIVNNLPDLPTVKNGTTSLTNGGSKTISSTETYSFTASAGGAGGNDKQSCSVYYATSSTGTKTLYSAAFNANVSAGSSVTYYFWTYDTLEYSSPFTFTVTRNAIPSKPSVTANKTLVPIGGEKVTFTFGTSGTYYYSTTSGGTKNAITLGSGNTWESNKITSTTTYYFYARNSTNEYSSATSITITVDTQPVAPTLKNGSTVLTNGGATIILSSTNNYTITATGTRLRTSGSSTSPTQAGSATSTTITLTPAVASSSTTYFWSYNATGGTSPTASYTVKRNQVPSAPTITATGTTTYSGIAYTNGSVTFNVSSKANTKFYDNTYIYYSSVTNIPSTSLNKIALSGGGAQTKTVNATINSSAIYRFWVYDGYEFSTMSSMSVRKAPTLTSSLLSVNMAVSSVSDGTVRNWDLINNIGAWGSYISSLTITNTGTLPVEASLYIYMLRTENGSPSIDNLTTAVKVTTKTINPTGNSVSLTSGYSIYNAVAAAYSTDPFDKYHVGWKAVVRCTDGLTTVDIPCLIPNNESKYYAIPRAPLVKFADIYNKEEDNTFTIYTGTKDNTNKKLYFYNKICLRYQTEYFATTDFKTATTNHSTVTIKIGSTTYTPTIEDSVSDNIQTLILTLPSNISGFSSHTTATLTITLKHSSNTNIHKICAIEGTLLRVRDMPAASGTVSYNTPTTFKPYSTPTNVTGNYTLSFKNIFGGTTVTNSPNAVNGFVDLHNPLNVAWIWEETKNRGTKLNLNGNTVGTITYPTPSATTQTISYTFPQKTFFNWSTFVTNAAATGTYLYRASDLYGSKPYFIRMRIYDVFGRSVLIPFSNTVKYFDFNETPTVSYYIKGNTYNSPNTYSGYSSGKKLQQTQKIKIYYTISHRTAIPNAASFKTTFNGSVLGTLTGLANTPGACESTDTNNIPALKTINFSHASATTSYFSIPEIGKNIHEVALSNSCTINGSTIIANSIDVSNNKYPTQPLYNPEDFKLKSATIFKDPETDNFKIRINYSIKPYITSDNITLTTDTDAKLYITQTSISNPDSTAVSNGAGNFTTTTYFIAYTNQTTTTITSTINSTIELSIQSSFNTALKDLRYITIGASTRTSGWWLDGRGNVKISNTVAVKLQTPPFALRQDNVGFFANDDDAYLGTLSNTSRYHPKLDTKGVIFIKAHPGATALVIQNEDDTNSFVYNIQNATMTLYTSTSASNTTWTEAHSIDFKNGIFK